MNGVIDNPADCEVRSVIQLLNAQNLKPAEMYWHLKEVYGDTVMNERNVRKWCEILNNGRTNVQDETQPGRPSLITVNTWLNELAAEEYNKRIFKTCEQIRQMFKQTW